VFHRLLAAVLVASLSLCPEYWAVLWGGEAVETPAVGCSCLACSHVPVQPACSHDHEGECPADAPAPLPATPCGPIGCCICSGALDKAPEVQLSGGSLEIALPAAVVDGVLVSGVAASPETASFGEAHGPPLRPALAGRLLRHRFGSLQI
jgi:hypothetical protein